MIARTATAAAGLLALAACSPSGALLEPTPAYDLSALPPVGFALACDTPAEAGIPGYRLRNVGDTVIPAGAPIDLTGVPGISRLTAPAGGLAPGQAVTFATAGALAPAHCGAGVRSI